MLNREKIDSYIKDRGLRCPYCGSEQLEGGFVEIDAGTARQPMDCLACGKTWFDVYKLASVLEAEE